MLVIVQMCYKMRLFACNLARAQATMATFVLVPSRFCPVDRFPSYVLECISISCCRPSPEGSPDRMDIEGYIARREGSPGQGGLRWDSETTGECERLGVEASHARSHLPRPHLPE